MTEKSAEKTIQIPEGIEIIANKNELTAKSDGKENKRIFSLRNIKITKQGNLLKISSEKSTKRELKIIGTIVAHIKNMINGIKDDFVYTLEICNVHFPMVVKAEGDKVIIKSFLGESTNRIAKIVKNSKVEVKGNKIIVSSFDIESAGQTAANIEKATKIKSRDRRIFQDGIFITKKPEKEI